MNHTEPSSMATPKAPPTIVKLGQQQAGSTAEGAPPPGMVAATPPRRSHLVLDRQALQAIGQDPTQALLPSHDPAWVAEVIALLNDALATEWVCVLRYRRHHFTARGIASMDIAKEFMVHAQQEMAHADRLAQRIVQLGGQPDLAPASLTGRSHAAYDESPNLQAMLQANLQAERVAIECYSQMIELVGARDPTTRRLLEDILAQEQSHAEELRDWLTP